MINLIGKRGGPKEPLIAAFKGSATAENLRIGLIVLEAHDYVRQVAATAFVLDLNFAPLEQSSGRITVVKYLDAPPSWIVTASGKRFMVTDHRIVTMRCRYCCQSLAAKTPMTAPTPVAREYSQNSIQIFCSKQLALFHEAQL